MSVERFLIFWSHNNTLIIEILIGLILLTVIYLAFRSFFGPESDEEAMAGAPRSALDSAQLEKLQKMLEANAGAGGERPAAVEAPVSAEALAGGADPAVMQQLKTDVTEKARQIEELKAQMAAQAQAASQGLSLDDQKKLEEKLKDLEARLAEYEIISEDIADLSFYKEENARLQKEVESASTKAPAAAEPVPEPAPEPVAEAVPEPAPEPPVVAAAAESVVETAPVPEPAPEAAPAPAMDPEAEAALQAMAESSAPAPAEEAPAKEGEITPSVPVDQVASADQALKEMADAAAKKTPADEVPPGEASQLMNQFENFVKKG
ncbi:MAG: hypothetical protein KF865_09050 [Bdellovibrionaceae bacterium]|nr:hypothetical protein [Pseudobdellovibrionaceae bacterium]